MTIPVIQSLVAKDGKYIVMPVWISGEPKWGNLAHPNPHANSSVGDTAQQYPVGTKFVDGDRTFFYGYCFHVYTATKANLCMFNSNEADAVHFSATAGVAGDTVVGVLATDMEMSTTPSEDDFAGGWFMPRTNPYSSYRILHSTTATGGRTTGDIDLTLDYGLIEAVTASVNSCYVNRSEWTRLRQSWGASYGTIMTATGVTLIDPIASTWQWVQSWGPCYVVPYNDQIGGAVDIFQAGVHADGSAEKHSEDSDHQLLGYMLNANAAAGTTASWLIRLQINC